MSSSALVQIWTLLINESAELTQGALKLDFSWPQKQQSTAGQNKVLPLLPTTVAFYGAYSGQRVTKSFHLEKTFKIDLTKFMDNQKTYVVQ
jgi:hypothetical protein